MSDIHVFDPEGDLILKIIDGLEDTTSSTDLLYSKQTKNGDLDKYSKLQDLLFRLPQLYRSDDEVPRVVMARVSRQKLCNASPYFKIMLNGGFAEAQEDFSTDNPRIIKLKEVDCDAALAMLTIIHEPDTFRARHSFTFDSLMEFTILAEYWDMLSVFHNSEIAWRVVDNVFRAVRPRTIEQRKDFFRDHLVDLFDAAQILNDRPAHSSLGTFVLKHLRVSDQMVFRPQFMTPIKTAEILANLESRIDHIKSQVVNRLVDTLKRIITISSHTTGLDPRLIPAIKQMRDHQPGVLKIWPPNVCLYTLRRSVFLLPLIEQVDFNRLIPAYTGSLHELSQMQETLLNQSGINSVVPPWYRDPLPLHPHIHTDMHTQTQPQTQTQTQTQTQINHWLCCAHAPSIRETIHHVLAPVKDHFRIFCIECFDKGMRGDALFSKEVRCEHWYTINWLDLANAERVRSRHERGLNSVSSRRVRRC